ncbi:MAG: hypothetical protein DRI61_09775 [Chloroflexi bacterium]|nr:MAG: hypothetical protein DRI61_09775 [Chloroflexota bacterium]
MRKRLDLDYPLLIAMFLLIIIGLMMLHSAGLDLFSFNPRMCNEPDKFFRQQLLGAVVGLLAMGVTFAFDYRKLKRFSIWIMLAILGMLVVVNLGGKGRWLLSTSAGRSLQPSEFARVGIIIYAAHWLSAKRESLATLTRGLIPFAIIVGIVAGLVVLQPDLSMAGLIGLTAVVMFFIAGADVFQWTGSLLLGGAAAIGVIQLGLFRHAQERIMLWDYLQRFLKGEFVPYEYVKEQPFWALESFISGGLKGRGLGQSLIARLMGPTLPSDGILALIGEELGLVGCLVVLGLLGLVIYRGFMIAAETEDMFGKLMASGIAWSLMLQSLIHLGSLSGVMPLTGMTLPFVSLGGSSLVSCMACVGLLLNIAGRSESSHQGRKANAGYDYRRRYRRPRLSGSRRSRSARR